MSELHDCGTTHAIDHDTGAETCSQKADKSRIRVHDLRFIPPRGFVKAMNARFRLLGSPGNPCFTGAPNIDWNIGVSLTVLRNGSFAEISLDGVVEPFPAFELIAIVDGRQPKHVVRFPPEPGSSPWNLPGGPTRRANIKRFEF